ncbi:hypothetical protein PR048_029540 [Dryococelus australis]|uniref:Uncharacterized protein n=1 Tax=Dryococelus australis TaxID=614101 RepID=A0ABQ9GDM7_9NEOP|nr:hypothetical protein PR048_029540 [Dryococelus australis]
MVTQRLACSPPTKANRVQTPAGPPDFRKWESCQTMPLVDGFSRGYPVSSAPSFRHRGKRGNPRENTPTYGIVQQDSHMRKSGGGGGDPSKNRTRFALVGGEWSNEYTTPAPIKNRIVWIRWKEWKAWNIHVVYGFLRVFSEEIVLSPHLHKYQANILVVSDTDGQVAGLENDPAVGDPAGSWRCWFELTVMLPLLRPPTGAPATHQPHTSHPTMPYTHASTSYHTACCSQRRKDVMPVIILSLKDAFIIIQLILQVP